MSSKSKPGDNGSSPPAKNPFPIAVPTGDKHPRGSRVSRWIRDFIPAKDPEPSKLEGPKGTPRPKKRHKAPGPIQRATIQMLPGRLEAIGAKEIQQEIRFIQAPTEEQVVTLGWNLDEPPGHVTLNHSSIQPLHAKMTYRDGGWWIENMEEHDPVVVNGAPVRPSSSPRLLADGDQVRIGAIVFKFFFP